MMVEQWFRSIGWVLLFVGCCAATSCDHAPDRINVRGGRFFTESSGEEFMPYGVNYCRLDNGWHSVFSIDCYNPKRFDSMLADLRPNGLNTVRIFLDHRHENAGGGIATDGLELSSQYLANLLDGLERARKHGIYVVLCLHGLPISGGYQKQFAEETPMVENDDHSLNHPMCTLGNMQFLHPGAVKAKAEFCRRVVQGIADHDSTLLATVFSYELGNEAYFVAKKPFSLTSGTFDFLGRSYDLSLDRELRQLADDAAVYWADTCATAIHEVDPKAMVSVNVFTYQAVGRKNLLAVRPGQGAEWDTEQRIPVNLKALTRSQLDYLDLHVYLHRVGESSVEEKLDETLNSVGVAGLFLSAEQAGMPLIVGEFAAFKDTERTLDQQAEDLRQQMLLCEERGFCGFMYWTYDTDEQPHIHNLKMNDGRMLQVMTEWLNRVEK